MRPSRKLSLCSLLFLFLAALSCNGVYKGKREYDRAEVIHLGKPADLILIAEVVHHLDPTLPRVEAIAIRDGRIVAFSSRSGIFKYRAAQTQVREFPGAHIFPGFVDAHAHLAELGRAVARTRGELTADLATCLLAAQAVCLAAGITRVHDAGMSAAVQKSLVELQSQGKWQLGVYALLDPSQGVANLPLLVADDPSDLLRFRAVLFAVDGSLMERTAALLAPYADDPKNRGLLLAGRSTLERRMRSVHGMGYQLALKADGDRAARIAVDLFEEVLATGLSNSRPRLEHALLLAVAEQRRLSSLGVIVSMQPAAFVRKMSWARARLGPVRSRALHAHALLDEKGVVLAFGSGAPNGPHSPIEGLHAAVTYRGGTLSPTAPATSKARGMSRRRAFAAYTTGPARAAFEEELRGLIKTGMMADLGILDRDIFAVSDRALLETQVLATVVSGKIVYQKGGEDKREDG